MLFAFQSLNYNSVTIKSVTGFISPTVKGQRYQKRWIFDLFSTTVGCLQACRLTASTAVVTAAIILVVRVCVFMFGECKRTALQMNSCTFSCQLSPVPYPRKQSFFSLKVSLCHLSLTPAVDPTLQASEEQLQCCQNLCWDLDPMLCAVSQGCLMPGLTSVHLCTCTFRSLPPCCRPQVQSVPSRLALVEGALLLLLGGALGESQLERERRVLPATQQQPGGL